MSKKEFSYIPEQKAIDIQMNDNKKWLSSQECYKNYKPDSKKGKSFELISYINICNKKRDEFNCDDTDGNSEFGIDSITIKEKKNGRFDIIILSCTYSGGFNYKKVDEIRKGLEIIFDGNSREIKNKKLEKKIDEIRKIKKKIEQVKVCYCINTEVFPEEECFKSMEKLVKTIGGMLESNCNEEAKIDFSFFGAKEIYEKKIRNENPLSKNENVSLTYNNKYSNFSKFNEELFSGGKITSYIITVSAVEIKNLYRLCGDSIFHYNIRGYQGKNTVNKKIIQTINSKFRKKFWFLNNGITLVCENAVKIIDDKIELTYPQIVNGQQTIKTIDTFMEEDLAGVDLLVRLYITNNEEFFSDIAMSTNSQTKIDYSDLSSNKTEQHAIKDVFESLGYYYKNKKTRSGKKFKIGVDSKNLGRIAMATINKKPSDGRKTTKDSIIFNEDNYSSLFGRNPYLLLLSFLIYTYCLEKDFGFKGLKRVTMEREIKHFGLYHLSSLIWDLLEKEKKFDDFDVVLNLIKQNDFSDYYNRAFIKLKDVIINSKNADKSIVLKDYFSDTSLNNLIF